MHLSANGGDFSTLQDNPLTTVGNQPNNYLKTVLQATGGTTLNTGGISPMKVSSDPTKSGIICESDSELVVCIRF